ncbi:DUF4262 domain-containing protein [Sphingomonas sp. VDB2]|uniref:DUF4262 domain-containing protein n=1 Tax=Sphingomonas sp. VDB2 TaxID=3228751 RepID=UPI003A7F6D6A
MTEIIARDDFERGIIENVREHGCQVNMVFDPDGEQPNFAYSIGFKQTVDQPEVITFGLSGDMMKFMINQTLRECREGLVLTDGAVIEGLLEGHKCIARIVHPSQIAEEYVNSALWYHKARTGERLTDIVQIMWPGAVDGLFPWDDGCDAGVIALQPALYEERLSS